jgi:xanthine dehydrogenase accessory factor
MIKLRSRNRPSLPERGRDGEGAGAIVDPASALPPPNPPPFRERAPAPFPGGAIMSPADFLAASLSEGAVIVRIAEAQGSTPREVGATMIVSARGSAGTIGGGQLEFHCIDVARALLDSGGPPQFIDIPLGPQMGQCCGGRVRVAMEKATPAHLEALKQDEAKAAAERPQVLIFGAGHTGKALARSLALLPLAVSLIDDRPGQFDDVPATISCLHLDDPETAISAARPGSAFVVLSHSHALDYRLTETALLRGDAAYIGMIGSATKRARFEASFRRRHPRSKALTQLTCPIGGSDVHDKRPEVIAALTSAELVRCLLGEKAALVGRSATRRARTRNRHDAAA